METIKDLDQHTVCTADPFRGVIERIHGRGKERILIYLPIGGEVTFSLERTSTVIRREGHSFMHVNRYYNSTD